MMVVRSKRFEHGAHFRGNGCGSLRGELQVRVAVGERDRLSLLSLCERESMTMIEHYGNVIVTANVGRKLQALTEIHNA
jgi:hypothetical protein